MSERPAAMEPAADRVAPDLVAGDTVRVDKHPTAVYLAGLSAGSRRTMLGALNTVAQIGLGHENATAWDVPWQRLRFQHTQALRSALAARYAYTTANRTLSALKGVLRAA